MFSRILVPLDGSPATEHALPIAARLARTAQGSLILVHVITLGTNFNGKAILKTDALNSLVETEKQKALDYLTTVATTPLLDGIDVELQVCWGQVAPELVEQVRLHHCDLILMSRKHHTGLKHLLPGSVAERVAMHSPVPVFLIHEHGPLPIIPYIPAGHPICILLGVDDISQAGPVVKSSLALVAGLAATNQPIIRLARVISPYATEQSGAQGGLLELMKVIKEQQIKHVHEFEDIDEESMEVVSSACMSESTLVGTDYAHELLKEAGSYDGEEHKPQFHLLAISSRFGQYQQCLHLGNHIVERITHETQLPVLIVPPAMVMDSLAATGQAPQAIDSHS
ncbi:hypothetical protein KDH_65350 [Dictyobacter sp. S3.2.2.5]|uniref:UspA domain-containing protein n=1 Tax=Dictyobacter halimunensis TaxID=3026934 RepID=A0ABQ6G3P0_9CHLR|nr:hypothetical protein KDH_65350 [Dictyobacter sp. S3.2.2.5]